MTPKSTSNLNDVVKNLSVRLSVDNQPVGSGFIVSSTNNEYAYILTARHCFDKLPNLETVTVEWYDYERCMFIPLIVYLRQYPLLVFSKEQSSYDIAILVIPYAQLPVAVVPINILKDFDSNQIYKFNGFPDALNNNEPEEFEVELGLRTGQSFRVKPIDPVEDNSSTAYANLRGFSGSGLHFQQEEQVFLIGIIADYKSFKRLLVYDLTGVNELLSTKGFPELKFVATPIQQTTTGAIDSVDFIDQCRQLLDEAERAWEELRPIQGLKLVRAVRKNVTQSVLSVEHRNSLLARLSYLEAFNAGDTEGQSDTDSLFIEANALAPNIIAYQERAVIAYLNKDIQEKAYELAEQILKHYRHNPYAWLVIAHFESIDGVPEEVRAEPVFKVNYLTKVVKKRGDKTIHISDCSGLFRQEIEKQNLPDSINRRTLYYWSYTALFALHETMSRWGYVHNLQRFKESLRDSQLQYAEKLLGLICQRIENSDLKNDNFFQVLRFEYCFCRFFLAKDSYTADQMANQLLELFIGKRNLLDLPYVSSASGAIESIPHRLIELLQILHDRQQGEKMLLVLEVADDTSYKDEPVIDLFKGMAYGLLKNQEKQVECLRNYLDRVDNLSELDTINFIDPTRLLLQSGLPIEVIQKTAIDTKTFEQPVYKLLLEAFIWSNKKGDKPRAHTCAEQVKGQWDHLSDVLKRLLARIYMELEDWTVAGELFSQLCNENEESEELLLYLIAIYKEQKDIPLFLKLAESWRERLSPQRVLIESELSLYRQLHNWQKTEEVSVYALSHFSDSISYWWDLVSALHAQGEAKKEALLRELDDERVFYEGFPVAIRFAIAHICFTAKLVEKALEICYKVLKANPDNPAVQQKYFSLSTDYKAFENLPTPDKAEKNTVIKLRIGDKEDFFELTEERINHNRVAKAIVGRSIGESFKLRDNTMGQEEEYTIVQILDKYSGQFALIAKKAEQPLSGLPMKSLKIDTDESGEFNIEKFHQQLQNLFGAEGTKRKIIRDSIRRQFANREIGFSELCQQLFRGDPIAAWEYATSDQNGGFKIQPMCLQTSLSVSEQTEYVLDFTSALTLFFLSKSTSIPFKEKRFIVSQFLIDYVMQELENARHQRGSEMSQDILIDRVTVYHHPEDLQERTTILYQELLTWINNFCKPDYAPERLNREFKPEGRLFSENNLYGSSIIDSLLLANRPNRILVTDDHLPFRMKGGWFEVITLEHFLCIEYKDLLLQQLWLELIDFNFRGLTLGVGQLYHLFKKSLLDNEWEKKYLKALYNFSYEYNPNGQLLLHIILFLKKVYTEDLSLDYKRQASQALLRRFFTGTSSITEKGVLLIYQLIDQEFKLMGRLSDYLKEDFDIVINSN